MSNTYMSPELSNKYEADKANYEQLRKNIHSAIKSGKEKPIREALMSSDAVVRFILASAEDCPDYVRPFLRMDKSFDVRSAMWQNPAQPFTDFMSLYLIQVVGLATLSDCLSNPACGEKEFEHLYQEFEKRSRIFTSLRRYDLDLLFLTSPRVPLITAKRILSSSQNHNYTYTDKERIEIKGKAYLVIERLTGKKAL